jgi:hypothetical protein
MPTTPATETDPFNEPSATAPLSTPTTGLPPNTLRAQCEKCMAPLAAGRASVCPRCGWYAVAGTFIDIDRAWEGEDESDEQAAQNNPQLPRWAWLAIASVVAVILESAVVRVATPDGSFVRSAWSGIQFLIGVLAFLTCQVVGFIVLMRKDSTITVLDVLLKPFKISGALFRDLPRRFWAVNAGISGLAAAFAAVAIIGSVPYHALWSWHVDYVSLQNLENALPQGGAAAGDAAKEDRKRKEISVLIIGYELTEAGNIRVVLVAREVNGKLRYTGGVTPTGESALLFELRENLLAAERTTPIIPMTFDSNWVEPKYACQISYATEQENKNLTDIRWEGGVRELRLGR